MPRHLMLFEVEGLFASSTKLQVDTEGSTFSGFRHEVPLNQDDGVTIITAPNGYGKTAVLKLIYAFFAKDYSMLMNIMYKNVRLIFDDSREVVVEQHREGEKTKQLKFIMTSPGERAKEFVYKRDVPDINSVSPAIIDDIIPHLQRVDTRKWFDTQRNQTLTLEEVWGIYGASLENESVAFRSNYIRHIHNAKQSNSPDWLTALMESIDCRFIETQRLLDVAQKRSSRDHRKIQQSITVVEAQAMELRGAIQDNLAEFTNRSQAKDRTFPHRVIEMANQSLVSEANLQEQIVSLESKRSTLVDVGILDSSEGYVPIAVEKADKSTRSVLQVYVEDNVAKLEVFDALYGKVATFLGILNEKFGGQRAEMAKKKVKCNKDKGIIVETGDGRSVELSQLSSGEQHEIVLFYDIVFRMGQNTLLLIDEPELSLHVGWQKKFVPDLLAIIAANEMRVLMATHSPQIINDRRDLRVSLGVE